MAKQTYLQLVNRVLKRITQSELTSGVSSATGQAKIISELINEAQVELWTETTNWHTLYTQRIFNTATYTAATLTFNDANPDTITDSGSGMGNFEDGQTIIVSGSASNDGVYVINTAAAGTLTLQSSDSLTAEAAGETVTISAVTYPLASDHGRTIGLIDLDNDRLLIEDVGRAFDESDPDMDHTNNPFYFSIQGTNYRMFYIPNTAVKILDRYWKIPAALSGDSDTSDLPEFCENFLIHWAWMSICDYMNKFDVADRIRLKIYGKKDGILEKIRIANNKVINKIDRFQGGKEFVGLQPPSFPSRYGSMRRW